METLVLWDVQTVIARKLRYRKHQVGPTMFLKQDLHADVIQISYIADRFCEKFDIQFPGGYFEQDRRVDEIVGKIEKLTNERRDNIRTRRDPSLYEVVWEAVSRVLRRASQVSVAKRGRENIRHRAFCEGESENCD